MYSRNQKCSFFISMSTNGRNRSCHFQISKTKLSDGLFQKMQLISSTMHLPEDIISFSKLSSSILDNLSHQRFLKICRVKPVAYNVILFPVIISLESYFSYILRHLWKKVVSYKK